MPKKKAKPAGEPSKPAGRPTSYRPEYAEQAKKLCMLGATNADMADFFHVAMRTLSLWRNQHPEFFAATKLGKDAADDRVEHSLYQRATGYSYDAVKIFPPRHVAPKKGENPQEPKPFIVSYREHAPPDTTACIFWLKNRRPDLWRDVQRHEVENVNDDNLTAEQLREKIVAEIMELGLMPEEAGLGLAPPKGSRKNGSSRTH